MSDNMERLLELMLKRELKHDASGAPDWAPPHGPVPWNAQYGPFAWPGTTPEAYSTLVRPRSIAQALAPRLMASPNMEPVRFTLTGVTDPASCANPDDTCGTPPAFGLKKGCRQSREYGTAFFRTKEVNVADLDQRTNLSDIDLQIQNMSPERNPLLPMAPGMSMDNVNLNNAILQLIWEAFVGWERSLSPALLYGDASNEPSQTECGFVQEFDGLVGQVTTGHTDILTGVACAAVDSVVKTWGQDLGDTAGSGDSRDFVKYLGDYVFTVVQNARAFGNVSPGWTFVMHPRFWRELTNYWPCNFDTTRCRNALVEPANANNVISINLDPTRREEMRTQMYASQMLPVEGDMYPVIVDDAMQWQIASAYHYTPEIIMVPLNLIDLEFKPMNGPEALAAMGMAEGEFETWNNGLWLTSKQRTQNCLYWTFTSKMRLHLKTPQIALKITNIAVESRTEVRSPFPGESYYKDGGTVYTPSYFPTLEDR